jgi:hypothetical protein
MEKYKVAVFDHVIDIESLSSPTSTWLDELINLIDMYSSPNLSKTIAMISLILLKKNLKQN